MFGTGLFAPIYRRFAPNGRSAALGAPIGDGITDDTAAIEALAMKHNADNQSTPPMLSYPGFCPICARPTTFSGDASWPRDHLNCASCENGSIPRERALMLALISLRPDWRKLAIHESSPCFRGISALLRRECPGYMPTYFFPPDVPLERRNGFRHEDIEQQTFSDGLFDLVITLDVMEHVFRPELVYREVWRTLRPGGIYLHTTPIYKDQVDALSCRALRNPDGSIRHLAEPEYHGDPIDSAGTLCTFHFGYDLAKAIAEWAPFDVEVRRYDDRTHGVIGEFTEVIICRKRSAVMDAAVRRDSFAA